MLRTSRKPFANSYTLPSTSNDQMVIVEQPKQFGQLVYVPDATDGFVLGRIIDVGAESVTVQLEPPLKGERRATYDATVPAVEDQEKDVNDNCNLMFLNEGTLLHNCRLRYKRKKIYTYVSNILISINPYEQIPGLYSHEKIREYCGRSLGVLPPHIFAIADKAYRELKRQGESQSIIVSGESGAGKTESQKSILHFLCENFSDKSKPIERRILETNPILEAFGNAKTLRNNNSSRFGKFVEVHFDNNHQVVGAYVQHYLLERSRICRQQSGERNYHIFYQLFVDSNLRQSLSLGAPSDFQYLRDGCTEFFGKEKEMVRDPILDDRNDFQRLKGALLNIEIRTEEMNDLFRCLGGILHLGNLEFEDSDDSKGGCVIKQKTRSSLTKTAELFGVGENELRVGLTTRIMQPTKSVGAGTIIQVQLKPGEAAAARDALCKSIYNRLFDRIVVAINRCIPFGDSKHFIGVLDIAGFEFFETNSFEQFCINYCNEKLQKFFNDRILKGEQELYRTEGLNVPQIHYNDNQNCIDLYEAKGNGLLVLLDEEARLPIPTAQHFTEAVHQMNRKSDRLISLRNNREYKNRRETDCFIIRHYAANVCYETKHFLEKNSDQLHESLTFLMEGSKNSFIHNLFRTSTRPSNGVLNPLKHKKLVQVTASSKFRTQLSSLIEKLENTGTNFVRCIKPNSSMKPALFEAPLILDQLRCAGMNSVLRLMQLGYPSRTSFALLYESYSKLLPERLARLDPRLFCKCLFHALGFNETDFKFGLTRVFFRSGKFAEFDQLLRQDTKNLKELIVKVESWICRIRWRKLQYGVWSVIKLKNKIIHLHKNATVIQSAYRGYKQRCKVKALLKQQRERRERERREQQEKAVALLAKQRELEQRRAELEAQSQIAASSANNPQSTMVSTENLSANKPKMVDQETQSTQTEQPNFTVWTFNMLRDLINTATDIELIRSSYQNWRQTNAENERAP
ncbi:hypothetical protein M3Y96_00103000 [Aphelenchoides besseyi]|nr:hypothetical protein M3Y96_00103000 [Aphelenchoides besseyi]